MHSTACPDWADRLVNRQSIIPPPVYRTEADAALHIFKRLRVVDLPGKPTFGECSEEWVFDFVAAVFGAYKSDTGEQLIREIALLISKKNTKSTIAAGVMLTATVLCWREEEEHLILAPTKEVADNSYKPAAAMVRADEELAAIFHVRDHIRTIEHRVNRNSLKVIAADAETASGKKAGRVLVDELWLFGMMANAEAMFMEALGGQVSRDEGFVIYLSTQSDKPPAGIFKTKLDYWRDVRDGKIVDNKVLPILFEFPDAMVASKAYMKPENFYITNPNIGRSVNASWIEDELRKYRARTDGSFQQFLAKHLNIQIGMNLRADRWAGADFWQPACQVFTLDELLERCEVCTVGIDGGGLDDLLGLAIIGREKGTGKWLWWSHAWAHRIVLARRVEIASVLLDFEADGDLTIVEKPGDDVEQVAEIVAGVHARGLLPEKLAIGVDAAGIGDIVDALTANGVGVTMEQIVAISQGYKLNGAIKTTERRLAGLELIPRASRLMDWCVGNARTELKGNAVTITKQVSGTAKIDPLMGGFNAVSLMALNPEGTFSQPSVRWA